MNTRQYTRGVTVAAKQIPECQAPEWQYVARTATSRTIRLSCASSAGGLDWRMEIMDAPQAGTAVPSASSPNEITYRSAASFEGPDQFTVRSRDANGLSALLRIDVWVSPTANTLPSCSPSQPQTRMGVAVEATISCFDEEGDPVTVSVPDGGRPANGTLGAVSPSSNGVSKITYTPAAGFSGTDTFKLVGTDGFGTTEPYDVPVVVRAPADNRAPTCDGVSRQAEEVIALAPRCQEADGDALTYAVGKAAHGTTRLEVRDYGYGDETLLFYTPSDEYTGQDSFTYTASDGIGESAPATVTVDVRTGPPPACTAAPDFAVRTNASRPVPLTCTSEYRYSYEIVSPPANGTVTLGEAWDPPVYRPAADFAGTDSFTVRARASPARRRRSCSRSSSTGTRTSARPAIRTAPASSGRAPAARSR